MGWNCRQDGRGRLTLYVLDWVSLGRQTLGALLMVFAASGFVLPDSRNSGVLSYIILGMSGPIGPQTFGDLLGASVE